MLGGHRFGFDVERAVFRSMRHGVRTVGTSLRGNRPQTDRRAYRWPTEKAVCSATAFFCPRNPL